MFGGPFEEIFVIIPAIDVSVILVEASCVTHLALVIFVSEPDLIMTICDLFKFDSKIMNIDTSFDFLELFRAHS